MGEGWRAQVFTAGRWFWCLHVLNGWGECEGRKENVWGGRNEKSFLIGGEGSQV